MSVVLVVNVGFDIFVDNVVDVVGYVGVLDGVGDIAHDVDIVVVVVVDVVDCVGCEFNVPGSGLEVQKLFRLPESQQSVYTQTI